MLKVGGVAYVEGWASDDVPPPEVDHDHLLKHSARGDKDPRCSLLEAYREYGAGKSRPLAGIVRGEMERFLHLGGCRIVQRRSIMLRAPKEPVQRPVFAVVAVRESIESPQ
jgi:hypothetical protein